MARAAVHAELRRRLAAVLGGRHARVALAGRDDARRRLELDSFPEALEQRVEGADLVGAADEDGARGPVDLLAPADVDLRQRAAQQQVLVKAAAQAGLAQSAR